MDRLAQEKFDIGIGEHYDSCTYALFHRVGVKKFISAYAVPIYSQAMTQLGLPLTTSFIPCRFFVYIQSVFTVFLVMSSHSTTEMSYTQRMRNFIGSHVAMLIAQWAIAEPLQKAINDGLGYEFNPVVSFEKS